MTSRMLLACSVALGLHLAGLPAAKAQQPSALVIEGGTLIDGNGGAPLQNSVIVIEGNKITSVSRKGQGSYPPGAQVINAAGKFVLPGLWDSQSDYVWYQWTNPHAFQRH